MKNKIQYVPSAIGLVLSIWLFIFALSPSESPQIFALSYFRLSIVIMIALVILYLSVSFWFVRLILINNLAAITVISATAVLELGLRSMPSMLPATLVPYLPHEVRMQITKDRGLMNEEMLKGDGLLYSLKPNLIFSIKPWVKIDSLGYRNAIEIRDVVDVVFLGDSVVFAEGVKKDFATRFRDRGLTAFNLALAGYGAYQYRDAYKKFVIETGLLHRYLIVVVTGDNDFKNSLSYARALENGGDYRVYLKKHVNTLFGDIKASNFPWIVSILINKMPDFKNLITGRRYSTVPETIRLPYGNFPVPHNLFTLDAVKESDLTWLHFKKAMDEILNMARDRGVKTLVAYHPPPRIVYAPLFDGYKEFKKKLEKNHLKLMVMLASFFNRPDVRFKDLTAFQQAAAARENICSSPMTVHLNSRGIELISGVLFEELQQMN